MRGKKFHVTAVITLVLSFVFLSVDLSRISYISFLANMVNSLTLPIIELKEEIVESSKNFVYIYIHNINAARENIELKNKLTELILIERELEACQNELKSLSETLKIATTFKRLEYSISRIIYLDPSGFNSFFIIEGGKDKGFKEGDIVVSKDRVIGIVETVFMSTSRVITPFNKKFSLPVQVSGKSYIYKGGFPLGKLLLVKKTDRIKKGQKVYINFRKRKFPRFLIGRVGEIEAGNNPFFKEVRILPVGDPREEDFVIVIRR